MSPVMLMSLPLILMAPSFFITSTASSVYSADNEVVKGFPVGPRAGRAAPGPSGQGVGV